MTTISTPDDVIKAAASIARDAAEGRLDPAQLDMRLDEACRGLVGAVAGPDDPLWPLQVQIARGVLAAGGIATDELAEWTAVGRRRENDAATGDAAPETEGRGPGENGQPEVYTGGRG